MMAQVNAGRVRFVGRGEYNNSTQYYVFDLVNYNGNSYYAKVDTIGNLPTDTTYWQLVAEKGNVGPTGLTGNGISSIEKTSTSGLVDTYTITFTNGNTTTFDVANGKGIDRIEKTATVGNIDTYTIYFNDNSTSTFEVANGEVTREELEEEVDRLSMIYNLFPTTSDEDTEMTLDGTGEVKLKKIGLKGNTYQNSTTGKNLLDKNTTNILNAYINPSTGKIATSGVNKTIYLQLEPNTTYTLSFDKLDANGNAVNLSTDNSAFAFFDNTPQVDSIGVNPIELASATNHCEETFTTDSTHIWFAIKVVHTSKANYDKTIATMQIEKGNQATSYEPYTGNQPSPNPDYPQDIQVVSGDNTIKITGKQLFEQEYILAPNDNKKNAHLKAGTYTLATCDGNGFGTHIYYKLFDKNNNAITTSGHLTCSNTQVNFSTSSYNYYGGAAASYMTITIDNDYTIAIGLLNATGDRQVMLVKGSEVVRTYAPYQSQSYAVNLGNIELCKIVDYQDKIAKSTGKNLLDLKDGTYTIASEITANVNNGEITLNGTATANRFLTIDLSSNLNLTYGEQYTISTNNSVANSNVRFRINDDGSYDTILNTTNATKTITYSSDSNLYSNQIKIRIASGTTLTNYKIIPQIEKGSSATTYEPYGKVWCLNKQIGKVVLDGSENWGISSGNFYMTSITNYKRSKNKPYSNYYQGTLNTGSASGITNGQIAFNTATEFNRLYLSNTSISSVNDIKNWLNTHNTDVYYVLATPTITEITDTTLIEQLDNLENAYSYDTQTNITQTNDDMPFILDVEALMSLKNIFNS